jgi:pyruvate dehydrogenase E2 component (dihydrolipoamide acetyltransferase)
LAQLKDIVIPDIGTTSEVTVIEVLVKPGDRITVDQPLITLESEKASMEIPSPEEGTVESVEMKVGNKVTTGAVIVKLRLNSAGSETASQRAATASNEDTEKSAKEIKHEIAPPVARKETATGDIHASPGVRRLARELGIELTKISGTGRKNRIQKEDLLAHIKHAMRGGQGSALPPPPIVDFAKFGEIETKPLSKIKKFTAQNLHRNWLLVPHITQHDEADITELETFRKTQQTHVESQGIKLTPLAFIMKAVIATLKNFPQFNASLDANGENLILKKYFHIGVAVDTPDGLVVPVIRDVNQKSVVQLAKELADMSAKARAKQLLPSDMQGSSFTISSLGGIGGTAFTPIVNLPDVAILGVSKAQIKPLYHEGEFVPRLMLPLSLSYDHRVIDGAEGARFIVQLGKYLTDIRMVLM